jgi:serine-type D-Ala-D-Ala carboxypeptidase/endopeptidase (penicillin-binding protein 4)
MKYIFLTFLSCICLSAVAQNADAKLAAAIKQLEADAQFKHAILSLYVVDSKTGKVIFDKNAQVGLAPASCQKVVTSVSAFELLGKGYRYKTDIGYDGGIKDSILNGDLIIIGYGDPTFGSERYKQYANFNSLDLLEKIRLYPIKQITGKIFLDNSRYEYQQIPKGWIWEDIGNYYGAGAGAINWRENVYSIKLKSGLKINDSVTILNKDSLLLNDGISLLNNLKSAAEGSGDNAFIRLAPYQTNGSIEGTIPVNEKLFIVKGAMPNPVNYFIYYLWKYFNREKIYFNYNSTSSYYGQIFYRKPSAYSFNRIYTNFSPPFDSINYWFLKKSINLYGEAFVKTIAYEKLKFGSTDSGIAIIKNFWKQKGIEPSALNIIDGSGLSPANRVTTNALVSVLQYAKQQPWFPSFYFALPEMNGIKMKDGYINGVRSYTGYVKSKTGNEYIFSFIVNNFDGSPGAVREKMWKVLDILK